MANVAKGSYWITPLGAAMVEALPDQAKAKLIDREFRKLRRCPTSEVFPTKGDVVRWYRRKGITIKAYKP